MIVQLEAAVYLLIPTNAEKELHSPAATWHISLPPALISPQVPISPPKLYVTVCFLP